MKVDIFTFFRCNRIRKWEHWLIIFDVLMAEIDGKLVLLRLKMRLVKIPSNRTKIYLFLIRTTISIKISNNFIIMLEVTFNWLLSVVFLSFLKYSVGDDIKKNRMRFMNCNMVIMQQKHKVSETYRFEKYELFSGLFIT